MTTPPSITAIPVIRNLAGLWARSIHTTKDTADPPDITTAAPFPRHATVHTTAVAQNRPRSSDKDNQQQQELTVVFHETDPLVTSSYNIFSLLPPALINHSGATASSILRKHLNERSGWDRAVLGTILSGRNCIFGCSPRGDDAFTHPFEQIARLLANQEHMDVLTCAALVFHTLHQPVLEPNIGPSAIIITHSKERSAELARTLDSLCSSFRLLVHDTAHPGVPAMPEHRRADFAVGTPASLTEFFVSSQPQQQQQQPPFYTKRRISFALVDGLDVIDQALDQLPLLTGLLLPCCRNDNAAQFVATTRVANAEEYLGSSSTLASSPDILALIKRMHGEFLIISNTNLIPREMDAVSAAMMLMNNDKSSTTDGQQHPQQQSAAAPSRGSSLSVDFTNGRTAILWNLNALDYLPKPPSACGTVMMLTAHEIKAAAEKFLAEITADVKQACEDLPLTVSSRKKSRRRRNNNANNDAAAAATSAASKFEIELARLCSTSDPVPCAVARGTATEPQCCVGVLLTLNSSAACEAVVREFNGLSFKGRPVAACMLVKTQQQQQGDYNKKSETTTTLTVRRASNVSSAPWVALDTVNVFALPRRVCFRNAVKSAREVLPTETAMMGRIKADLLSYCEMVSGAKAQVTVWVDSDAPGGLKTLASEDSDVLEKNENAVGENDELYLFHDEVRIGVVLKNFAAAARVLSQVHNKKVLGRQVLAHFVDNIGRTEAFRAERNLPEVTAADFSVRRKLLIDPLVDATTLALETDDC